MTEQEYVVKQFQKAFAAYREEPCVIYGLGKNTEAILQHTEGFCFAGLMDRENSGKEFWGLKVLSDAEVLKLKPRIIIVAREPVVPIIYERIAYLQKEHGIEIYDFKGELLGQKQYSYESQDLPYWRVTEKDLKREIDEHDCISFDIFDTLLMRKVLRPEDVFDIVERILEARGYKENNFKERRTNAESSLPNHSTIHQIYCEIGKLYHIPETVLTEWKRLEFFVEAKVIVPRRKMIEIYRYALQRGKNVFLVSDMYFSEQELGRFLTRYRIVGYNGLLVSCDYRMGKKDGSLYDAYKQMAKCGNYLHIGDNRQVDGERARERGIDSFQIYSAYEMWMASSMQKTLVREESLEQRCILGSLVWKCCENPFALHKGRGVFNVNTSKKLGYVFLGVLFDEFVLWLTERIRNNGVGQLLLPSRDGFLIKQMLIQSKKSFFDAIYFKASRRAVSVAAIQAEEDILLLASRGFQGNHGDLLVQRFGVQPRENDERKNLSTKGVPTEDIEAYVLSYKDEIIQHAKTERENYLAYLESVGLMNGKKQAIFDFVASGTVQYYLQKLLDKKMQGIYFATMNHPNEKYQLDDCIVSAYGNIQAYSTDSQVGKHYLFLETIMVDGYPTLKCVKNGNFVYESGKSTDYSVIQGVQKGILEYQRDMEKMRKLIPEWGDERAFADKLFGMLFDGSCQVVPALKQAFANDDVFDGIGSYRVWQTEEMRDGDE